MVLLQQEHFLCENKDVDVLMYQIGGKFFFNATVVWRNFGSPTTFELKNYLRTQSTRKLIVDMYGKLNGFEKLLIEINKLGRGDLKSPQELQESNTFFKGTYRLSEELEKDFIFTKSHDIKNGGTFLCYKLFVDYCMHLSTALKSLVIDTFEEFGDIVRLKGHDKIDALQRKIDAEKANLPTFKSKVVAPEIREEVKARTKALQRAIYDLYYTATEKPKRNMYSHIHNRVNSNLFGMTSENMQKLIALSQTSRVLIRDYMTEKAIRLLEQVEAAVYVVLVDWYEANIQPNLNQLNTILDRACDSALSLAFLIKNDFHLLQNAIERDYDLLVKNADCVKDLGVVPRPDEVCEKTKLIPITNATKQLVSEIPKRDNKGMSEQLTLF